MKASRIVYLETDIKPQDIISTSFSNGMIPMQTPKFSRYAVCGPSTCRKTRKTGVNFFNFNPLYTGGNKNCQHI